MDLREDVPTMTDEDYGQLLTQNLSDSDLVSKMVMEWTNQNCDPEITFKEMQEFQELCRNEGSPILDRAPQPGQPVPKPLAAIPKGMKSWASSTDAMKTKVMRVYYRLKTLEVANQHHRYINVLMNRAAHKTVLKKNEASTTRNSRVSASEMYRLAYLMQDPEARCAWTKAYLSKDDRLEYENGNDPFDALAEMYMKGYVTISNYT